MQKVYEKRAHISFLLVIIFFAAMIAVSLFFLQQVKGGARVVNYVGIVRGATQKLIKKELLYIKDDVLIEQLDAIIGELMSGEGPNGLIVLRDAAFLENMRRVQEHWVQMKDLIQAVRNGEELMLLYEASEEYFILVDRTVLSAETFYDAKIASMTLLYTCAGVVFALVIAARLAGHFISRCARKAEKGGKDAYYDLLTRMPNRSGCEKQIEERKRASDGRDVAVILFDMNNLKRINKELTYQVGDRLISDFARILQNEARKYGFIGRYGGDEFIVIISGADTETVKQYLMSVNGKIVSYNLLHVNELEKISFAVGYWIGNMNEMTLEDIISEASKKMNERKNQIKEYKE